MQPIIRLTRKSIVLIWLGGSVLLLAGCRNASNPPGTPVVSRPPQTNYPMPPVKANPEMGWTLSSDQHVRLADYKDKVVVLDFYATWCEPCRDSTPHLVSLQERYGPQGLQVIGLNVGGEEDRDRVSEFAREFHVQYQLGFPDSELETLYLGDDYAIPQTFVIDRKGQVMKRFVGYNDSVRERLERLIQTALDGE